MLKNENNDYKPRSFCRHVTRSADEQYLPYTPQAFLEAKMFINPCPHSPTHTPQIPWCSAVCILPQKRSCMRSLWISFLTHLHTD